MRQLYLGIEIGGTKQQIAVCDGVGGIIDKIAEKVPHENGAADIQEWVREKSAKLLMRYSDVKAIGIGFGGPLETRTGRVLISVQVPGWKEFELKKWMEGCFHLPVTVVNDTVAGGYAELKFGSGQKSGKFFYTNIGTGIGGALFVDGRTWDGIGYGASYMGNTYMADWTTPSPGKVSRIETLCSGTAIEKRLRSPGYVPKSSKLYDMCQGDCGKLDCRLLEVAAINGDLFAEEELDLVCRYLGICIANVISMLGVDTVALGGGIANLGELILEPVRKYTDQYVFISGKNRYQIVICKMLDNNVPIGAALYAQDGFNPV